VAEQKIVIIGAGLAGSLLSIYLARRGFQVDVFEARGDMRNQEVAAGRSINLALSDRGIAALREVGMDEYMLAEAVPMYGRMIHPVEGETKLLRYSGRDGEYINSVSRAGLNIALINEAEKYDGVQFIFNERCVDYHSRTGEAVFASGRTIRPDTLIATDGAGSAVRNAMVHGGIERFDFSQKWLEHGYKELHIPPAGQNHLRERVGSSTTETNDNFAIEKNALHIWPRHRFMMIALPNFDGSFTCTLFLDHTGTSSPPARGGVAEGRGGGSSEGAPGQTGTSDGPSFDQLTDEASLLDFFNREFPDAVPLMPTLVEDFFHNPTGNLGTIKCFPWNIGGKALLLGDSAHAIVPFYGQGMNCAFEDVRVLDELIEKHGMDWQTVYEEYGRLRKPNTDAIADMAEENFYEMRDATADPIFQRKRELETRLEQTFPDYFSKYSMVTFREDLPYAIAKERGNAQDRLLMDICKSSGNVSELDLSAVISKVRQLTSPTATNIKA
jgi:kynurenine 3-monooxygenase